MKYLTTVMLLGAAVALPQTAPTTIEIITQTRTTTESLTSLTTTTQAVVPPTTIATVVVVPKVPTQTSTTTRVTTQITTATVVSTQVTEIPVLSFTIKPAPETTTTTKIRWAISSSGNGRDQGCHNGMNWWQFKKPAWESRYANETNDETIIAIGSPWNLGHNHDVWERAIKWVELVPFKFTRRLLPEEYEHCNWRGLTEVRRLGVLIAKIDYYSLAKDFNITDGDSLKKYQPSDRLEDRLVGAIEPLYPWREITVLTVVGILGPLLLFAGFAFCCLGAKRRSRGKN